MSILDTTYRLYEKIWNSPNREEVRKVVDKLQSSKRGLGNKIYPTPILGLLVYTQQGFTLGGINPEGELGSWSERELKILFGVHKQILQLNQQCLSPLAAGLPKTLSVVNPYTYYPYAISTDGFEELLFNNEDAEEIIGSFHTHPAFGIALENISEIGQPKDINYGRTILRLENEMTEAGPGNDPGWVEDFKRAKRINDPSLLRFRHASALLCLRDSLANLDQLIYQAIYQDEPIHIDQSLTIDYTWTHAGGGIGMWLMYLPIGIFIFIDPGDVVQISTGKNGFKKELFRIETHHLSTMDAPGILIMRMIDENLNAYRDLIR
jgi:hypothetical protein